MLEGFNLSGFIGREDVQGFVYLAMADSIGRT